MQKRIEKETRMNKEKIYKKAIGKYGVAAQLDMVIEEMSELTKEICKIKRGKGNYMNLVEEIADVEIMLEQLKMICQIRINDIHGMKYQKLERLKELIENDNH